MNLLYPRLAPLLAALTLAASALAQTPAATPPTPAPDAPALTWHDVTTWGAEGRAFGDLERKRWFDRFPAVADGKVTAAVWNLSRDSAGMMVRFKTDAAVIWADITVLKEKLNGVNSVLSSSKAAPKRLASRRSPFHTANR
jgi:hypothetical protein